MPADPTPHEAPDASLHHAHLMATDLAATVDFWTTFFGAELVADLEFSGSRNVFLKVGGARLHLYDQPPNRRGPVNHLGVLVEDLDQLVERLRSAGWSARDIRTDPGTGVRYSMVSTPDDLLVELFQVGLGGDHDHLFVG